MSDQTAIFIEELIEAMHEKCLEWTELRPACSADGGQLGSYITLRATINDCINMQRLSARRVGQPVTGNDGNYLSDFMVTHQAYVIDNPKK